MKKKNQNYKKPDLEKILSQFNVKERPQAREVWDRSILSHRRVARHSEQEVEEALQNVHVRIDEKNSNKHNVNITGFIIANSRYLVAAIALIVIGLGFFMVPKTISVPNAEVGTVQLPDGSTVEINSGSTLQYSRLFAFTHRTLSLNGEAYFSVKDGEDPFIVEANGSTIEVTGTEFNVRSWSDDPGRETTVTVTEGTVEFYPADNRSNTVFLKAGQTSRLTIEMNSPATPVTAADDDLAWRENRIVFQETALIVILNELERSFDVDIELDVDGMEYETLTAYYNQPADIETILEDICTVKGLRYTKTTDGYRIFQ